MSPTTVRTVVRVSGDVAGELMDATGLAAPSVVTLCRPVVAGLLSVIDDPIVGVTSGSARHAHAHIELAAPVPLDVDLEVRATVCRAALLGAGGGLWIDVDVDGPAGAVLRSRHVVAVDLTDRPEQRGSLPSQDRRPRSAEPVGSFTVTGAMLSAYRRAAADTSPVHQPGPVDHPDEDDDGAIVPGLLSLLASRSILPGPIVVPMVLSARFLKALPVARPAAVASSGSPTALTWTVTAGDPARAVLAAELSETTADRT